MTIAAIDQGTTSTRALRLDDKGARIMHAVKHTVCYPRPGWVEQDAEELLRNILACLAAAAPVDAIGLANQGESCLAWDALSGAPLCPVIVWQDNRTSAWLEGLREAAPEVMARAGLPLDAYFPAAKFAWILREIPQARAALAAGRLRLGTTDAFFLDRLTGTFATDVTTASRTSLMNIATGQWDAELCRIFGVPPHALPQIRDSAGAFGTYNGVPVRASLVDQQAALFGHGCRAPGDAKITFGTGAFALAVTGASIIRAPGQGLLPTVAWSRAGQMHYALEGGVYDAGAAVDWGMRLGLYASVAELDSFQAPPAISRRLAFVPALSGLACPHWDRSAAALWVGMGADTTKRDMAQALLEGIALRTAEVVRAMDALVPLTRISVDGGLTRSAYFIRFLANVLQREILLPAFDELTAFGCAALAADGEVARPGGVRTVTPDVADVAGWHETFTGAVRRAKGWR
ncbi:FGGY family carbohydrate kinase [Acidocella sp.]|uniref:FGGY family carbohydrate kinase n=1 Tax=Acidocella sp. TaxID=50710 RepID=UPI002606CFEB|nr:FGGY family carbohydrate kinase [Acidocella sp.]